MITLKQFMELCDYRITEGSDYTWNCFGSNVYCLSSWNGCYDGWSMNIVFSTRDQTVYEVDVCDYKLKRAYRMILPEFRAAHDSEAEQHGAKANEAWDQCNYVDLDVDDDFIEKAQAIKSGEDYDTRVSVPVNFPDDVLLTLMKQAHEADITFNQYLENLLKEAVEQVQTQHPDADWSDWNPAEELEKIKVPDVDWSDWEEDDHEWDDSSEKPAAKMKKSKKKS